MKEINEKILKGEDASVLFSEYLTSLASKDCNYANEPWTKTWVKEVYDFGSLFTEYDAGKYLITLKTIFDEENPENEKFAFIYSEIAWNYFGNNSEHIRDILRDFTKKYPYNPEFHHTYGHFLMEKSTYDRAFDEYEWALTIDATSRDVTFLSSYLGALKDITDHYLSHGDIDKASNFLKRAKDFLAKKGYLKGIPHISFETNNALSMLTDRVRDHEIFKKQVGFFEAEVERKISIAQKKLIEVLGIFSAVVAFILTNVSIMTSNLSLRESLILMLGMANVLLIFSISISYLFGRRYRWADEVYFLKQNKFWAIIALITMLIVLVITS